MTSKRKTLVKNKRFGKLLGSYDDKDKKVKIYQNGNQVYFVKDNEILPEMTMHVDDVEMVLELLQSIDDLKEED